jgi:ubiquinol-cytochrome c reductase cytochrome c subunit
MRKLLPYRAAAAAVVLAALLLAAVPVARCGPDDTERDDRLAVGRRTFLENCLMCHSEEMTARSRLTEKQWAIELDKMVGWGAPVPPESKGPLLEYLVSQFSDPKAAPVPPPERITIGNALSLVRAEGPRRDGGDVARGATLYATNCANCHGPDARGGDLGTCLVEKPVLLRPTDYHRVVRDGRFRMPGFRAVLKPDQEADILAWLCDRRFDPTYP